MKQKYGLKTFMITLLKIIPRRIQGRVYSIQKELSIVSHNYREQAESLIYNFSKELDTDYLLHGSPGNK